MPKNLVVCCDGTANEFSRHHTNVVKLFATLEHSAEQCAYYQPGLGTMEAPGTLTPMARRITRWLGMALGTGLDRDVANAYIYIARQYDPGDRLFLFGFSRGAYTARAVA